MGYKIGQLGRTTCAVLGVDGFGNDCVLPEGALVEVCDVFELDDSSESSEKPIRYSVVQCAEDGSSLGDRAITYDGAWDGFLVEVDEKELPSGQGQPGVVTVIVFANEVGLYSVHVGETDLDAKMVAARSILELADDARPKDREIKKLIQDLLDEGNIRAAFAEFVGWIDVDPVILRVPVFRREA